MEKDLAQREKAVVEREEGLSELQKKVDAFPDELKEAVNKAVEETTKRIMLEAKNKEELTKKEFEGERNVLKTRIESLEKTVKEQSVQIANLSGQVEKSYQKVQDIAIKSVEGSSNITSFANLQQLASEQIKKQSQEK